MTAPREMPDDPLWYKDAVIYELHVRSFFDSAGDGIGDFVGLTRKLDYLQDLGVTALWLLPFYPSPLKDDGYDIADYVGVHPAYGALRDFRTFIREAHRRGLRIVTELVVNHTSDRHPWFLRARRAPPGSRHRNFYVWSETPERYRDARILFPDFETSNWTWDPAARAYYWHRFYAHQPDLNYDSPDVRRAIFRVVDFWMGMGVDGMRLDAIPYLVEREGTACENLPETHQFLRDLRRHIEGRYPNRMLLSEANQWPEDAATYFGKGDESHMAFHFPLMPRLFMSLHMEDRFPLVEILQQTPAIPEGCQWALFLRNHDELTLETVTDEERDYMVRTYAVDPRMRVNLGIRRRLAPLLGNHRRSIELLNALLFSLPGTPVIYYGDEIGMGDNVYLGDRDGVRTPMQWSADRNAGFSRANPQRLYLPVIIDPEYHYEAVNAESQQANPRSLLWWMKRLIATNRRFKAFGRGTIDFLHPENRKILAFLRRHGEERILVVANLSRYTQCVELDLAEFRGQVPVEVFGHTEFPVIGDRPYFLSLGPHAFHWFTLEVPRPAAGAPAGDALPELELAGKWPSALAGRARALLAPALTAVLQSRGWAGSRRADLAGAEVVEVLTSPAAFGDVVFLLTQARFGSGPSALFALPVVIAAGERAAAAERTGAAYARLRLRSGETVTSGVLADALEDPSFAAVLLDLVRNPRSVPLGGGRIEGIATTAAAGLPPPTEPEPPTPLRGPTSRTLLAFGGRVLIKFHRRLEPGIHPESEMGRFLAGREAEAGTLPFYGEIRYRPRSGEPLTVATAHAFVVSAQDGWSHARDALGQFFEHVLTNPGVPPPAPTADRRPSREEPPPEPIAAAMGAYTEAARGIGRRTAALHRVLASDALDPAFAPEPATVYYLRAIHHAMLGAASETFQLLRRRAKDLPEADREAARRALDLEAEVRRRFNAVRNLRAAGVRLRCHGDYHLGQLLFTGKDFLVVDLEGESSRPLGERRIKRSPLRDVAAMIRSFHAAAAAALAGRATDVRPEDRARLADWARGWRSGASAIFLRAYLDALGDPRLLPSAPDDRGVLIDAYLLEHTLLDAAHALRHRSGRAGDSVRVLLELLGEEPAA